MTIVENDDFFDSSGNNEKNKTKEERIQEMSAQMTPDEDLEMWKEKINDKAFLLVFLRLYHESVRKHGGTMERQPQRTQSRDQRNSSPQQNLTLADILNAMSKP